MGPRVKTNGIGIWFLCIFMAKIIQFNLAVPCNQQEIKFFKQVMGLILLTFFVRISNCRKFQQTLKGSKSCFQLLTSFFK